MHVVCSNIGEFLAEIAEEGAARNVWRNVVRVTTLREWEQDECHTCLIQLTATALIGAEQVDYLLEFTSYAGKDGYKPKDAGTLQAAEWSEAIAEVAKDVGLKIRPGKYELF